MKLKKLLILFMMLSMVVCAIACGNSEDDDIRGQINGDSQSSESSDTSGNEDPTFSLNNVKGSTYESTFLGIGWSLPGNWFFFDEAQLKQVNNITVDMMDDEKLQEALQNATIVCDMYAMNSATGDTLNIQLEKLTGLATLYDAETYVDVSISSLPTTMQSAGYADVTTEKTTVTIAGEEHPGIYLTASYNGASIREKLVCIKVGNYMAVITAASSTEDTLDAVFANFFALSES